MNIPILYEDYQFIVVDKPAGVVVNRAESVKEETVQDWAEEMLAVDSSQFAERNNKDDFISRSGIVHRLDKETSGCLIIAKNPESFVKLQTAFKERLVKKTYITLVHGKLMSQDGEINAPVDRLPWNRELFGIIPGGKESVTKFKTSKFFEHQNKKDKEILTLVEAYPQTGRTHQIRVHFKYLGYPIVGDYLYAGRKVQKRDRLWCPRVFLHASKITFPHSVSGNEITVESPLPQELQMVLKSLTKLQ